MIHEINMVVIDHVYDGNVSFGHCSSKLLALLKPFSQYVLVSFQNWRFP